MPQPPGELDAGKVAGITLSKRRKLPGTLNFILIHFKFNCSQEIQFVEGMKMSNKETFVQIDSQAV